MSTNYFLIVQYLRFRIFGISLVPFRMSIVRYPSLASLMSQQELEMEERPYANRCAENHDAIIAAARRECQDLRQALNDSQREEARYRDALVVSQRGQDDAQRALEEACRRRDRAQLVSNAKGVRDACGWTSGEAHHEVSSAEDGIRASQAYLEIAASSLARHAREEDEARRRVEEINAQHNSVCKLCCMSISCPGCSVGLSG